MTDMLLVAIFLVAVAGICISGYTIVMHSLHERTRDWSDESGWRAKLDLHAIESRRKLKDFDPQWDVLLNELMDKYYPSDRNEHTVKFGSQEVWIENYPYSYANAYYGPVKSSGIPSAKTIRRLRMLLGPRKEEDKAVIYSRARKDLGLETRH